MDPITPAGNTPPTPPNEPKSEPEAPAAPAPAAPAPPPATPPTPAAAPVTPPATPPPTPPAAPATPQPAAGDQENPGKSLGIIALVLSLLGGGLISLILAIIAKKKSKAVGAKNTPATIALILSIIGMIVGTIILGLFVLGFGALSQACGELGPGVHLLDNGTTLSCE